MTTLDLTLVFFGQRTCLDVDSAMSNLGVHTLGDVQLSHAIDLPVKTFSSGMTKRTAIARLLLQQPKLLLLDEPYTGLDQNSVRWFQEYLIDFKNQGGTLLLVTHQLELGLELATRVLLLNQRKIVKNQSSSMVNLSECQQWLSQS